MKVLGVIVVFVALVAGVGFYRGWFSVASNNADAKSEFTLSVDKDKVLVDRKAATEKVADLGQQAKDRVAGPGGKDEEATTIDNVSVPGEKIHDGTVVSVGDELKMMDNEGNEHGHIVAADADVTRDGMACKATDLKPGMKIRVTTAGADPQMVTRIEALDHRDEFEKTG